MVVVKTKRTKDIKALRENHEALRLSVEAAELQSILESYSALPGRPLVEAWGQPVDPMERFTDTPTWQSSPFISLVTDRKDGACRPIFETETELAYIRGAGQHLCAGYDAAINIMENLTNYTIGKGFTCDVKPENEKVCKKLVEAAKYVLKVFQDDNDFVGITDREIHQRSRRDGEAVVRLVPDGWRTRICLDEPAQLRQPANSRDLEDWLGVGEAFASSWTFGVHTKQGQHNRPLGYYLVGIDNQNDWDYCPSIDTQLGRRLGCGVVEHIKRNVDAAVKRGISDYYPALRWLELSEKLLRNTIHGSAIQAAIAFIRQHSSGSTATGGSGIGGIRAANTYSRTTEQTPAGSRVRVQQRFEPGSIVDVYGAEYVSGPMGSQRVPPFISVIQAALRYVGTRWSMPEYMISGDASNANFASTLVAESPFVKAREADQTFYQTSFLRVFWKALKFAYDVGFFAPACTCGCTDTWEGFTQQIQIVLTPSKVATRDPLVEANTARTWLEMGIKDKKTIRGELGMEPETEEEKKAGAVALVGADLNGAQVGVLQAILTAVAGKQLPTETARAMIKASFTSLTDELIDKMLAPLATFQASGQPGQPGQPGQEQQPPIQPQPGEFGGISRLQAKRNIAGIRAALQDFIAGKDTEVMARQQLAMFGLQPDRIEALIQDALDNKQINDPEYQEEPSPEAQQTAKKLIPEGFCPTGEGGGVDNSCGRDGEGGGGGGKSKPKNFSQVQAESAVEWEASRKRQSDERIQSLHNRLAGKYGTTVEQAKSITDRTVDAIAKGDKRSYDQIERDVATEMGLTSKEEPKSQAPKKEKPKPLTKAQYKKEITDQAAAVFGPNIVAKAIVPAAMHLKDNPGLTLTELAAAIGDKPERLEKVLMKTPRHILNSIDGKWYSGDLGRMEGLEQEVGNLQESVRIAAHAHKALTNLLERIYP